MPAVQRDMTKGDNLDKGHLKNNFKARKASPNTTHPSQQGVDIRNKLRDLRRDL